MMHLFLCFLCLLCLLGVNDSIFAQNSPQARRSVASDYVFYVQQLDKDLDLETLKSVLGERGENDVKIDTLESLYASTDPDRLPLPKILDAIYQGLGVAGTMDKHGWDRLDRDLFYSALLRGNQEELQQKYGIFTTAQLSKLQKAARYWLDLVKASEQRRSKPIETNP